MSGYFFPVGLLPPRGSSLPGYLGCPLFEAAIGEAQNNIRCPREMIYFSALTCIAVAVQGVADVRKPNGQIVPLSLMVKSIASSGERKSTTLNVFLKAIRDFEKKHRIRYQEADKHWRMQMMIWETKKKFIKSSIAEKANKQLCTQDEELALIEHERLRPAQPRELRILFEDTTPEALFKGLSQHCSSAGLVSSEGGAILDGRALKDLAKHNALWSGDTIIVDRSSGDSFTLSDARLTISMMVQEEVFAEYMSRRGERSRAYGLWARFIVCQPMSTQGTRLTHHNVMSWEHCEKFASRMTEILEENVVMQDEPGRPRKVLSFSLEACDRWIGVYNAIETEICVGGRFDRAGDHASKLADNIARVAALLHYFEFGGEDEISLSTLDSAIRFCFWCSDEFLRLFVPPPREVMDANELFSWLQVYRNGSTRWLRKNFIRQCGPNKLRKKDRLDPALDVLCQWGAIAMHFDGKTLNVDLMPCLGQPPPEIRHT